MDLVDINSPYRILKSVCVALGWLGLEHGTVQFMMVTVAVQIQNFNIERLTLIRRCCLRGLDYGFLESLHYA